jgi:hypothetical protein
LLLAISEATGRFVGEIERDMEADELMLWAEHFDRKSGKQVHGITMAQLTARLAAGGAKRAE